MKIDPSLPKPPRSTGVEMRDLAVSRFADLLDGQSGRDQVASFAELSMFGRPHATAAPATAVSTGLPIAAAGTDAEPMPAAPARPADSLRAGVQAPQTDKARPPVRTVRSQFSDGRHARSEPSLAPAPELRLGKTEGAQSPDAPVEHDPLRRARLRARQATVKAGISLILSEENGAVRLVVGGPPLDPEQRSGARRLAERVLAESGLELAHFQLNGAAVGPGSTEKKGGRHGTRSD
jgi:hypothetical protein